MYNFKIRRESKLAICVALFFITTFLTINQFQVFHIQGHSPVAEPIELFSIWNETAPTIDGNIDFKLYDCSQEWTSAAVYNLFNEKGNSEGKLLVQNDNVTVYIALDCTSFIVEVPSSTFGMVVYLDLDHNGWLSTADYRLRYRYNSGIEVVDLYSYSYVLQDWVFIEEAGPGIALTSSGIIVDTGFSTSAFNNLTAHRQYEIKIPYSTPVNDKILGWSVIATSDLSTLSDFITWPVVPDNIASFANDPSQWGDIHLGDQHFFEEYIIEDNFNIKDGAIGPGNNTYLTLADINGDGDKELVVVSNRRVSGDDKLIAIFDYVNGKLTRIWGSWESEHYSDLFQITEIAAYDFDEDGKDELYGVGSDSRIGRLYDWNDVTKDFDESSVIFDNYGDKLLGHIAIGDAMNKNDGSKQILFGDETGQIGVLTYSKPPDKFTLAGYLTPYKINREEVSRIHELEIADMDGDAWNELLFFSQINDTDSISPTMLQIIEMDGTSYYDNPTNSTVYYPEDDLPAESHNNTLDYFGHTIVVADVDNDGENETVIVGRNTVKIFGQFTFNDSSIPLEFNVNDGSNPNFAGGAAVFDIDGDAYNELIIGCSNGTVKILQVANLNATPYAKDLVYTEEWSADIGATIGAKSSIIGYDIDEDNDLEIIIGDYTGQIIILGIGNAPSVSFTSPSSGYTSNRESLLVQWSVSNDSNPMEFFDIYVNGAFQIRAGSGQQGAYISLLLGSNDIEIYAYDVLGFVAHDYISIEYSQSAPEVTITDPQWDDIVDSDLIQVSYDYYDPEGDAVLFDAYVNGSLQKSDESTTSLWLTLDAGEGIYNITIIGKDTSNNKGKDTVFIIYDNSPPYLEITSPIDNSAVKSSSINLEWDGYDEWSWVEFYQIYLDGESIDITDSHSIVVDLPFDKQYQIQVVASDAVGHNKSRSITITRDTVTPTVALEPLALPQEDNWYYTDNPSLFVEWTGVDNSGGSGIDYFELEINDVFYSFYDNTIFNDTIALSEGFNEILIMAWDKAGNYALDYYTIALDTFAPSLKITSPEDGFLTSSEVVTVFWEANDNGTGIKEYAVFLNGLQIDTLTDPSSSFYEFTIPANASSTITILAIDYLGHFTERTISVQHNTLAPSFNIIDPIEFSSYSYSTTVNFTWNVKNIFVDQFYVFVNGTLYGTYSNTTLSTIVDFGAISPSDFPVYNVTIAVLIGSNFQFVDMRFVWIDQLAPSVAILTPNNLELILEDNLYIEWSAFDSGSGIAGYNVWINTTFMGTFSDLTTAQFFDVSSFADGHHNITVEAFDAAHNTKKATITVELYPQAPEFSVNIPQSYVTNNPNFNINLTVFDPRLGVKEVQVIADGQVVVYYKNYFGSILDEPFWLEINVSEENFVVPGEHHNLTITVYDTADRGRTLVIEVIIDKVDPSIFGSIIFGDRVLSSYKNEFELSTNATANMINISLSAQDNYGVASISLIIESDGINETIPMTLLQELNGIYIFASSINLSALGEGNFTLSFIITDNAGNSIQTPSYPLELKMASGNNGGSANPFFQWLKENLYTIVLPVGGGLIIAIIFSTILVVATKKKRINKGWQKSLEAVAYVTKNGLTLTYVPYSKDLFEDEQLFGGALTGIVGILGEITGETDLERQTQVLEFGEKRLIVAIGYFGNAILLVNDVKPILKELVLRFLDEFEVTFKNQLTSEIIDLNEFSAAPLLVESIFGFRKEFYQQLPIDHYYQEANFSYPNQYSQEQQYSQEGEQQQQDYSQYYSDDQNYYDQ